jgi:hypothetical protein
MHLRILYLIAAVPFLATVAFWTAGHSASAAEVPASQTSESVEKLVKELDAPQFFVRESAMQRLRKIVSDPIDGTAAIVALNQLAMDPQLSFETHKRLTQVLVDATEIPAVPAEALSTEQIQQLISELSADRFALRDNAARRLRSVLKNETNIVPLLLAVRAKLLDLKLSTSARQELEQYYDECRRAWLLVSEEKCPLPEVKDEQIERWVRLIAQSVDDEAIFTAQRMATRELEDLLVRSVYRERANKLLSDQLSRTEDPAALVRLNDLINFTRPAMVAEIWSTALTTNFGLMRNGGSSVPQLMTTQYLHVGVPQYPEGSPQATFFDYCDDKRAHCVTGNTLRTGDYPVRSAIPHPDGQPTFFYLISLPTPRDRLLYQYSTDRSEAVRLREIAETTCNTFLTKTRKFVEEDVRVLELLDQAVVGHFAGEFFSKVDDAPLAGLGSNLLIGHTSVHGAICCALAKTGTKDAAPGIIKAIESNRILPPDEAATYQMPMIALLAIAERDPWDGVEAWLHKQLEREDEPLVTNVDPAPDLAATAAAILGERLGQSPQALGLTVVGEGFCQHVGLATYRFENAERREIVLKWFRAQSQELARRKAS